jgi:hypothetical protein
MSVGKLGIVSHILTLYTSTSTAGKAPMSTDTTKTKDNAPADGEKKTKKVRRKLTLHISTTVSSFIRYLSTDISQDNGYS